jgi:hypothetical protein
MRTRYASCTLLTLQRHSATAQGTDAGSREAALHRLPIAKIPQLGIGGTRPAGATLSIKYATQTTGHLMNTWHSPSKGYREHPPILTDRSTSMQILEERHACFLSNTRAFTHDARTSEALTAI